MMPNPLLQAFEDQGHGWALPLLAVLRDFETRLQTLGSDPPESNGPEHEKGGEAGEVDTESANRTISE
jgi:hypothetical protein